MILKNICQIAGFALLFSIQQASAEVLINQKFQFFQVKGETSQQIFRDFQKQSPIKAKGKYDATLGVAAIKLVPEVHYEIRNKKCHVSNVFIKTDIIIHLPRWANYDEADPLAQLTWDRLFSNIKGHELTHAAIAKEHANKLEAKILKYRPRTKCESLDKSLKKAASKILIKHDKAQRKFDKNEYRRLLKRK